MFCPKIRGVIKNCGNIKFKDDYERFMKFDISGEEGSITITSMDSKLVGGGFSNSFDVEFPLNYFKGRNWKRFFFLARGY